MPINRPPPVANDDDAYGEAFDNEDEDFIPDDEALEGLRAVARLAKLLPGIDWFGAVGRPLKNAELTEAENYSAGLGFFDVSIGGVEGWREAAAAAEDPDWNPLWWEAEDQAHQALMEQAERLLPSHDLEVALSHVSIRAAELAQIKAVAAAARAGIVDDELIKAAAQAAAQAAYQAALVLAAQPDDTDGEHAFAAKFRLFEMGRWPLGLTGNTLNLF